MDHIPFPELERHSNVEIPTSVLAARNTFAQKVCEHSSVLGFTCLKCRLSSRTWSNWDSYWDMIGSNRQEVLRAESWPRGTTQYALSGLYLFSWMYYGVLSHYFEHKIDFALFGARKKTDQPYVNTTHLNDELTKWHKEMLRCSPKRYEIWAKNTEALFTSVVQVCHAEIIRSGYLRDSLPKGAVLAMQLLYETLDCAKRKIDGRVYDRFDWGIAGEELGKILEANGWCPSERHRARGYASIAYYAALLGIRENGDHSLCTKLNCSNLQLDEKHYKVRHVNDDSSPNSATRPQRSVLGSFAARVAEKKVCSLAPAGSLCDMVVCSKETLIRIIQKGLVPLVTLNSDGSIDLVECKIGEIKFVAISHVWGDGCGNPNENSLPRCQILQIRSQIAMLGAEYRDAVPIFMDTLCVPVARKSDPLFQDSITARKWMISMMNNIYKSASVVLVRDRQVMATSAKASVLEMTFQIIFSPWFTRLWTYQEAVAAKSLKFCVSDGIVDCHEYAKEIRKQMPRWASMPSRFGTTTHTAAQNVWEFLANHIETLQHLGKDIPYSEKITRAFDSGSHRRTSHDIDELVCVSGIIGFDQQEIFDIMGLPDEEKTIKVVSLLKRVPYCVMTREAPRLSTPGFKWCPQRLLRYWSAEPGNGLQVTSRGVLGMWKSVYFTFSRFFELSEASTAESKMFSIEITNAAKSEQGLRVEVVTRGNWIRDVIKWSKLLSDEGRVYRLVILTPPLQDMTRGTTHSLLAVVDETADNPLVAHRIGECGILANIRENSEKDESMLRSAAEDWSIVPGKFSDSLNGEDEWLLDGNIAWYVGDEFLNRPGLLRP